MTSSGFVTVVVSGAHFTIAVCDIVRYPGNYFEQALKLNGISPVVVDRDSSLFKYVYLYLIGGGLPRDETGRFALSSEVIVRLKAEAQFFQLGDLELLCDKCSDETCFDFISFSRMRKFVKFVKTRRAKDIATTVEYGLEGSSTALIREMKCLWFPFCAKGKMREDKDSDYLIYKNSSTLFIDVPELLQDATFTAANNCLEIGGSDLVSDVPEYIIESIDLTGLCPQGVVVKPLKMQIHQAGVQFPPMCSTVHGEGHIGTLVLILNSAYTGGELEVSHGTQTATIQQPWEWIALYDDCNYQIHPVTSGTRVSLVYELYLRVAPQDRGSDAGDSDDDAATSEVDAQPISLPVVYLEPPDDYHFWFPHNVTVSESVREVCATQKTSILAAVSAELALPLVSSLVITLQHLYQEPVRYAELKGGDRALYDLLHANYQLEVVNLTIYHRDDKYEEEYHVLRADFFSPEVLADGLNHRFDVVDQMRNYHLYNIQQHITTPHVKIVIASRMTSEHILEIDTERGDARETVYIVSGIQLCKRE